MSGAFGSGAAFAFEDAYVLARAIDHVHQRSLGMETGLRLYDEVRSPHYKALVRSFHLSSDLSLTKGVSNLARNGQHSPRGPGDEPFGRP